MIRAKQIAILLAASMTATICIQARSAEVDKEKVPYCDDTTGISDTAKFASYDDNYVLAHQMRNNGWARNDEAALRVQYSIKYSLYGCPLRRNKKTGMAISRSGKGAWELSISYTGKFDFYAGTRDSGPVINRISNPGLHLQIPMSAFGLSKSDIDGLELSVEHRSDGQVFEPTTPAGIGVAQAAYAGKDRYLFDTVSRGANYIGIAALWQYPQINTELHLKFRGYFSKSSEVTWGPMANKDVSISDYDFVQARLSFFPEKLGRLDLDWRLGSSLRHSSVDIGWQSPWDIPVYVRVHRGPMNTLSNYTQRQDSIGVGLRFAYF